FVALNASFSFLKLSISRSSFAYAWTRRMPPILSSIIWLKSETRENSSLNATVIFLLKKIGMIKINGTMMKEYTESQEGRDSMLPKKQREVRKARNKSSGQR